MKRKFIILLSILIHVQSCTSNQDSNDLKQKIEEEILKNLFQTDRPLCSEEENAIMVAADTGNYAIVMDYLKNGGDPMLECEGIQGSYSGNKYHKMSSYMNSCDSLEKVKYYLTLDVSKELKDEYLHHYLVLENDEMVQYLISIGAHFDHYLFCFPQGLPRFKKAAELGYNLDWQDPDTGNNLFMNYAWCENEKDAEANIIVLKYLVSEGTRTDLKNIEGKTALDLATNEKIKAYLMSLEK
ncbi:MAG: ankyrin repeat protein [Crocinitomix sp.]